MLIAHGTADTVVALSQSETLVKAFQKAGVECEFIVVPGGPHTFNLQPKQKDLRPAVLGFLARHLRQPQ